MSYSNDHSRVLQADSKLFDSLTSTGLHHSNSNKALTSGGGKIGKFRFCLRFVAFFSHVGLGFLVLVYTVLGAFIFRHLEESTASHSMVHISEARNNTVNKLWTETYKLNVLYKENWTAMAIKEIEHFQKELVKALHENKVHSRWSFTDSWIYSISIITTIGYANHPSTSEGKIATILYALFGIPIFLFLMSRMGGLLGELFKSLYSFCCGCTSDSHRSLVNVHGHEHEQGGHHHHHHHLHEDYQVHHIPLTNLNGGLGGHTAAHHLLACDPNGHSTATYPGKATTVPVLNTSYHPRCSYETDFSDLEAETKLCAGAVVDPVEHLCSQLDNSLGGGGVTGQHQHCTRSTYLTAGSGGLESFFRDDPAKLLGASSSAVAASSHHCANSSNAVSSGGFEMEGSCETVPIYFCFLLIVLYVLCGSYMFYIYEGWSILDGAYWCFVTLSTIGFGGIPEKTLSASQNSESKKKIILIVCFIFGGMTLIAMTLNIIYEQLAFKFQNIGTRFQLRRQANHSGSGRDIKKFAVTNINCAQEDIDV